METKSAADKIFLPHHEQQPLCTTRLPYRQGRKLTAVKVYTINDESRHLLVFGVPSLNIRQETKSLFQKFGKITQFNLSPYHKAEQFTETYHLIYEKIQSARIAKRIVDTKNFYGGLLHVCYAPEHETVQETKQKLVQRKKDVLYRLQYLKNEDQTSLTHKLVEKSTENISNIAESMTILPGPPSYNLEMPSNMIQKSAQILNQSTLATDIINTGTQSNFDHKIKLYMGEINTISIGKQIRDVVLKPKKRKTQQKQSTDSKNKFSKMVGLNNTAAVENRSSLVETTNLEVIDATSVNYEIVTNINEPIQENIKQKEIVIKRIQKKPVNVIKFNITNKKT